MKLRHQDGVDGVPLQQHRRKTQGQGALRGKRFQRRAGVQHAAVDLCRTGRKSPAGLGQGHLGGAAGEQGKIQLFFQIADLVAQGGLGAVQLPGGGGKIQRPAQGEKTQQLAVVHGRNLSFPGGQNKIAFSIAHQWRLIKSFYHCGKNFLFPFYFVIFYTKCRSGIKIPQKREEEKKEKGANKMEKISRKGFLKVAAAAAMSGVTAGALAACNSASSSGTAASASGDAVYTPGTYTGTATGIGEVKVTMTFSETAITDVVIDASNETESIGGVAAPTLQDAIMAAQNAEIDNVSGATVTTNAVKKAAASCIEQAMGVASEEPAADTAGDTGDDWLGEEPDVQASETQDFDVVIIGAGLSGVCAARAAAEEGAKVAIVEKSSSFNCRSGEYALLNGSLNKRWGRENIVDEDVVVDRLMRECTYRNKRSILKKWASHAHEVMDWFIEAYPELTICDSTREAVTQEQFDKGILVPLAWPQPEHYDYRNEEFPTFPSSMEFRSSRKDQQGFIVEANLNKAIENGAQTFFGCFGTKLLKDSDGRVTGVIIRDAQNDNKYIQLNASKGVILATGDNSGDEKIMKHFAPEIVEKKIANMGAMGMLGVDVEGKTVETGDGLRMGAWIGAKVQDFHAPMTHHMGSGMGVTPFLQINKRGDRFMNECIPGQQLENQIELQPECTSFQLYDSKWGEEVPYMPANHGGLCYIIPEDEDESNPNYTDRQYTKISAKAEAYQFKADTLEDLLTQCGFEGDALDNALASVERYNELAKAGSDDDFGKPASRMFALENPPYYACQWGTTSMLVCVGGLESDENCHTFTEEDPASPKRDIIKGLYVCGNVQGSRYAVEYPICMRGISHSLCVYYGYIAGKNCVAGV